MYKRILVALDGSASAEHALPAAVALSRLTRATIHVVRVHEPSPSAFVTRGRWDDMSRRHELESLRATAARLVANGAAEVDVALVEGVAAVAIQSEVSQRRADLVLMTDRGRSPSRIKCLGCVSASVMRHTQVPLLVMRAADSPADLSHGPIFRNVLLAIDDPEGPAEVREQARELGRLGGGCRLWQTRDPAITPVSATAHAAAGAVDGGTANNCASSVVEQPHACAQQVPGGLLPNATVVEAVSGEDTAKALFRAIAAKTFDLVAIPASRNGPHGSVSLAQRVASVSRVPIFICPTSRHSKLPIRITALC